MVERNSAEFEKTKGPPDVSWVKSNELSSKKKHKSSSILQGKGPQLPTIPSNKETQGAHAAPVPVEKGPGEFFSFYMLNVCHPAG